MSAAFALVLLATTGCDENLPTGEAKGKPTAPPVAGEVASFSFDAVVYVEPSMNNIAVLDRVRSVTRSGLSALQHRRITVNQKRQVDIDLNHLSREPVTVVDPVTKATHAALRVRYRFVGVGVVPKELAQQGDGLLGLLHSADPTRAAEVVEACNDPAERAGDAVKQPWRAFDPGLEACGNAMEAEQTKIDAAREGLAHPEREIVPIEEARLYLPVLLRLRARAPKAPRAAATAEDGERPPAPAAVAQAPTKPDEPRRQSGASSQPTGRAQGDNASPRPAAVASPSGPSGPSKPAGPVVAAAPAAPAAPAREGAARAAGVTTSAAVSKPAAPQRPGDEGANLYPDSDPSVLLAKRSESRLLAKLKEQDRQDSSKEGRGPGPDDYGLVDQQTHLAAAAPGSGSRDDSGAPGPSGVNYGSSSHENAPNFMLLWAAGLVVLVIFGAELRRRLMRGRRR